MCQDPEDLLSCARSGVLYVVDGEVDLFVSAGAGRVGDTGHRADNEEHVLDAGENVGTVSMSQHQKQYWERKEGRVIARYRQERAELAVRRHHTHFVGTSRRVYSQLHVEITASRSASAGRTLSKKSCAPG